MASMASVLGLGLVVACGVGAARNRFEEESAFLEQARDVACLRRMCQAELVRLDRGLVRQRLQFSVNEKTPAEVECQRGMWLTGPYDCYTVRVDDRNGEDFR